MDVKPLLLVIVFIAALEGIQGHRLSCASTNFRCFNGNCISRSYFCNGGNNCNDNSDEQYCSINTQSIACPTEETPWFMCNSGTRCIPRVWVCDGAKNCLDGSDETQCGTFKSIAGVPSTINNLVQNFFRTRNNSHSITKWGPKLARITVALFLSDSQLFAPGSTAGAEIAYELSLQMVAKLALKKKTRTQELALFINALTVSCINPKAFFGVDLVAELRRRVDNSNYSNPFTFLTLCNAGDSMTPTDVAKVKSAFYAQLRPLWTDVQALATMAMACMKSQPDSTVDEAILTEMLTELKAKQHRNGTVDNMKTTAMVLQALISTNSYRDDFDLDAAVKFLVREVANSNASLQEMYYVLPVLKSMSLVNVSSKHCSFPVRTELEVLKNLRETPEDRIQVRVSMFLGTDIDFVRTWKIKVPASYNFYQVLENIGSLEPPYKVRYSVSKDRKPYIVGMSNHFDDAEDEMFWFIFSQKLQNASRPTLVQKSPVDIQVKEGEELILWYRSGVWLQSP